MDSIKHKGIAVAGSVIVDKLHEIAAYPPCGQLTQILQTHTVAGGCVSNVAVDLKKLCPKLPVRALGRIGRDEDGAFVTAFMAESGVDVSALNIDEDERTSFTQVMSVVGGQRTFLTYPGAGARFGYEDVDFDRLDADLLHLGYFLLLEKVDNGDGLRILQEAKRRGVRTSIDLVSEASDRYHLVLPCLAYTDYLIVNEYEAGKLTGLDPEKDGLEKIARRLMELGVRERVVIHMPQYAVCLSHDSFTRVPSYRLPDGYIKGTTGAGDAFCAGVLAGICHGWSDQKLLEFGSACAVMSLGQADATSGLACAEDVEAFCKQFERCE